MSGIIDKKEFEEKLLQKEAERIINALRTGLHPLKATVMFHEIHNRLVRAGIIDVDRRA